MLSHPAGVRGLKHADRQQANQYHVAPRRGAWIETKGLTVDGIVGKSHPAGVRGLKLTE